MLPFIKRRARYALIALSLSGFAPVAQAIDYQDHYEFEASLNAPYRAQADHSRTFELNFRFPGADDGSVVAWRLDIVDGDGFIVRTFRGEASLDAGIAGAQIHWSERDPQNGPLPYGFYQAHLRAHALNPLTQGGLAYRALDQRIDEALAVNEAEVEEQTFAIQVGPVAPPSMPAFKPLHTGGLMSATTQSSPAAGNLPYTAYLGNLHSQTNHSDGAGPLSTCVSEQNPQSGQYGPADAYQYALNEGLDILMTSEHNHMFDGSTGTNASANPATAKALFQSGLTAATNFNAAHPGFLAVYGLEWGVINNGGHMNIFNTPKLLEWEYNGSNQLIGDVFTAKSDYATLYTLMRTNGWIGQFNHPATSGQFAIGGTSLAYSADGDQVMVLCEVMNSSAFSHNTTETETSRSSYEAACNKLLEAGYHVAFSSDQDNHCSNWGASYTNRTGILIPTGTAISQQSFLAALQARHVYATYDKTSQIVLTTNNGHIMGDRFSNAGPLTLTVNYAPGAGKSASQVQIFQGVPGSNGTVSQLSTTAVTTTTPTNGDHFYYAKVTQNDGNLLYSAPVWVTQGTGGGDTTAPTVSASESGTSGTIALSATASDNVGVTKVEFYVDNALIATDTSAPYSTSLDSTTLTNASHSLIAKAYDAAGNVGTSSMVAFTISNSGGGGGGAVELISNGGFESGTTPWSASSGVITNAAGETAHAGTHFAWLDGYGSATTDTLAQTVTIPASAVSATLSFWMHIDTAETSTTKAYDTLSVQLQNSSGTVLTTLATYSNLNANTGYAQKSFNVIAYKGQTVKVYFKGVEDSVDQTSFVIDDVSLKSQ